MLVRDGVTVPGIEHRLPATVKRDQN